MNKRYVDGRNKEYLVQKQLRLEGYESVRSAGSKGNWDIVAWLVRPENELEQSLFRFIQSKTGIPPKREIRKLSSAPVPHSVQKELWIFKKGSSPRIIILSEDVL